MLNEVRHKWFKKTVQMVTYAPHFISVVVIAGMALTGNIYIHYFLQPAGAINFS